MSPADDLIPVLKTLRMSGVLQTLDLRAREAVDDALSFEEFLLRLLTDEVERRESKRLDLRLRRAGFENERTLETFDFGFNPGVPKARIVDLAAGGFLRRKRNVLLIGPSGTGKSHIAQAIGHRACRLGRRVLFIGAHQMLQDLRAARADDSYARRMTRFTAPDLLIVDDLGLRALRGDEPEDLYEVIRRRYERGSIIISSNRAIDEWYALFGDALLASAAMDRLLHEAEIVEMVGDSYRNPPKSRRTR